MDDSETIIIARVDYGNLLLSVVMPILLLILMYVAISPISVNSIVSIGDIMEFNRYRVLGPIGVVVGFGFLLWVILKLVSIIVCGGRYLRIKNGYLYIGAFRKIELGKETKIEVNAAVNQRLLVLHDDNGIKRKINLLMIKTNDADIIRDIKIYISKIK